MIPWRRLVRNYGNRVEVSQAMRPVAKGGNLVR